MSPRAESILFATLGHEPSWRLGEEHDEESEGNSRSDLKTGNESANTEEELLESSESASNGRVGDLGLVEGSKKRKHADTDTGKETTGHHHALVGSSGLENTTDDEDDGTHHDSGSSRESIGNERRRNATNKGTEQH